MREAASQPRSTPEGNRQHMVYVATGMVYDLVCYRACMMELRIGWSSRAIWHVRVAAPAAPNARKRDHDCM